MGLDQTRLDGKGMKIVLYLFKRQAKSSLNWEMDLSDVVHIVKLLWKTSYLNYKAFLKSGPCIVSVCPGVCGE